MSVEHASPSGFIERRSQRTRGESLSPLRKEQSLLRGDVAKALVEGGRRIAGVAENAPEHTETDSIRGIHFDITKLASADGARSTLLEHRTYPETSEAHEQGDTESVFISRKEEGQHPTVLAGSISRLDGDYVFTFRYTTGVDDLRRTETIRASTDPDDTDVKFVLADHAEPTFTFFNALSVSCANPEDDTSNADLVEKFKQGLEGNPPLIPGPGEPSILVFERINLRAA